MNQPEEEKTDRIKFERTSKTCYRVEGKLIILKNGSIFIINGNARTIAEVNFNHHKTGSL
jgi:hypothetical protein